MSLFLPRRLHRLFFLLAALVASLSAVHGATPEKLPGGTPFWRLSKRS